jgi:hypothetical protein
MSKFGEEHGGLKFLSVQCCREFGWFGCVENFVGKFYKDFAGRVREFSWFNFFEDGPLARALPPPPSNQPCAFVWLVRIRNALPSRQGN